LSVKTGPSWPALHGIADRSAATVEKPAPKAAAVIKAGLARIDAGTVLKGSCWDFCDAVYADAGVAPKARKTIYSAAETGPYADPAMVRPGDWVSTRNIYSGTVSHSAIFVAWLDFEDRSALMIDYPGNSRPEPGRFRVSDLSKIWMLIRPAE
jgi:hypothetical protein